MDNTNERGPSWYDASVALEELWDKWGVRADVQLLRPVRRVDGRGYTSWCVGITLTERGSGKELPKGFYRPFGQGGGLRTAPAALYWAASDADAWLEERRLKAETQAAF